MQHPSLSEARKSDVHYELLTLRDAMRRFGVYQHRVYRWVEEGRLHPVKPGGRTLYPAWELEALTDRNVNGGYAFAGAA